MPAASFIEPMENILNDKCCYEYFDYQNNEFSTTKKSRILHIQMPHFGSMNSNIVVLTFTIRNQNGKWKIQSEGSKRQSPGDMVPIRNTALKLARDNDWKFVAVAIAGTGTETDIITQYVVAIESYTYGNETVYDLSNELRALEENGYPDFYRTEIEIYKNKYSLFFVKKERFMDYLVMFDDRPYQMYSKEKITNDCDMEMGEEYPKELFNEEKDFMKPIEGRVSNGYNKIYYGIPGCGKSYKVSNEVLAGVSKENIFRTTFYLDYTNSDFIGQLVPKTDKEKHVTYEPNFGPFSKALKRACETTEMVYLVIEEINRGNAAAIFGDLFQLLDRLDEEKVEKRNDGSVVGDSEYPITNNFIEDYLHFKPGNVIIPSNLTILATMNTSDQNVFPLDTAFKRRWDREKVVPKWEEVDSADLCIPFTDTTWRHFVDEINQCMTSEEAKGTISEDKKIGPYFIGKSVLVSKAERHNNNEENKEKLRKFTNNVVDYLYNDVTKFDHELMFSEKYSYENVYNELIQMGVNPDPMRGSKKLIEIFANKLTADIKEGAGEETRNETGNNTEDSTSDKG